MVLYGLALVLLAEHLRKEAPGAIQAWYTDDLAFIGWASTIGSTMNLLQEYSPARDIFQNRLRAFVSAQLTNKQQPKPT